MLLLLEESDDNIFSLLSTLAGIPDEDDDDAGGGGDDVSLEDEAVVAYGVLYVTNDHTRGKISGIVFRASSLTTNPPAIEGFEFVTKPPATKGFGFVKTATEGFGFVNGGAAAELVADASNGVASAAAAFTCSDVIKESEGAA